MCVLCIVHLVERFLFTCLISDCVCKRIYIFSALKDVNWDRFLWYFVFKSLPYSSVTLICSQNNSKHINLLSKKVFCAQCSVCNSCILPKPL